MAVGGLLVAQAGQGSTAPTVNVPCDVGALITQINLANAAMQARTLNLAPWCTYGLTVPAVTGSRGDDGLPIITGAITMVGHHNTIGRYSTSLLFRIFEVSGSLTLRGVNVLRGDAGRNTGGGILSAHGTVSLVSASIAYNAADNGAGISNDRGRLTLSGSVVRGNSTLPGQRGGGGGIYNDGTLTLTSSSVINNRAETSGGAIYNELGGQLIATNSKLDGNEARRLGGGLFNGSGGTAFLRGSSIQFNVAGLSGGGIYNANNRSSITLRKDTISYNEPKDCQPVGNVNGCTT